MQRASFGRNARRSVVSTFLSLGDDWNSVSSAETPGEFQAWPKRSSVLRRVIGTGDDPESSCSAPPRQSLILRPDADGDANGGRDDPSEPVFASCMTPEAKSYGIYAYGVSLFESGQHARALGCYNRALVLQRESLGADHETTGRTLQSIGACLMRMGPENSFAALAALEEALYIRQLHYGEGDTEAATITEDIWTLLHQKKMDMSKDSTPDQKTMVRDMQKQKSKKELQSFVFRSVRRRGSMWSTDSVQSLQPDQCEDVAEAEGRYQSSLPSSVRSDISDHSLLSTSEPPVVHASAYSAPASAVQVESSPTVSDEFELELNDVVQSTTTESARRRRRNSLIGKSPNMSRIGEDSLASMHLSQSLDFEEALAGTSGETVQQDESAGEPPSSSSSSKFYMSSQFQYTGVSLRDLGDLGDRWAKEADESYANLKAYELLREEALEMSRKVAAAAAVAANQNVQKIKNKSETGKPLAKKVQPASRAA